MSLKCHRRVNDGKEHRYWSIAEKRRVSARRVVDRHVLYLGEINDSQRTSWLKSIEAFDQTRGRQRRLALFPSDRAVLEHAQQFGVQVRLKEMRLRRPRQWGACWAFCRLWAQLDLESFWAPRLAASREGTRWVHVLLLLGEGPAPAAKDTLYRCLVSGKPEASCFTARVRMQWSAAGYQRRGPSRAWA